MLTGYLFLYYFVVFVSLSITTCFCNKLKVHCLCNKEWGVYLKDKMIIFLALKGGEFIKILIKLKFLTIFKEILKIFKENL